MITKSNDDEIYDKIYDEIGVKTASKYLARMTGYSDPEFEPSVYRRDRGLAMTYGDSHSSLSLVSSHSGRGGGDFPIQPSTWQWRSRLGQPAQDARAPIFACTEHAQFVDVS